MAYALNLKAEDSTITFIRNHIIPAQWAAMLWRYGTFAATFPFSVLSFLSFSILPVHEFEKRLRLG